MKIFSVLIKSCRKIKEWDQYVEGVCWHDDDDEKLRMNESFEVVRKTSSNPYTWLSPYALCLSFTVEWSYDLVLISFL